MFCIVEIAFPILVVLHLVFLISVLCYSLSRSSIFQRMLPLFREYQAVHYYKLFCDDELSISPATCPNVAASSVSDHEYRKTDCKTNNILVFLKPDKCNFGVNLYQLVLAVIILKEAIIKMFSLCGISGKCDQIIKFKGKNQSKV